MKRTIAAAALVLTAACAVVKPPSGGPEDRTPPRVVSVIPAPGSTALPADTGIDIVFSEKIDGESFRKRVEIYPPVEFDRIGADGERLEIRFEKALPETTIALSIGSGYSDLHGVKSGKRLIYYFATADSIDPGVISGRIMFKSKPDSTGLARLLKVEAGDTITDVWKDKEARTAFAASDGGFSFEGLPVDGTPFVLWGFTDRNSDGRYSPGDEFHEVWPDTIRLSPERTSVEGIVLDIIDPDEPGSIEGGIEDSTATPGVPTVRFEALDPDGKDLVATADSTGAFILPAVPPGFYLVRAFIDVEVDSLPGSYIDPADSTATVPEPRSASVDTLEVGPGEKRKIPPITIKEGG